MCKGKAYSIINTNMRKGWIIFMKVLLFNVNKDELNYIWECNKQFKFELEFAEFDFNSAGKEQFSGIDAIWITTNCKVNEDKGSMLYEAGVRYIVSRAAGTDHIDVSALKKIGLKGGNVPKYSPNAIAEHTVCLTLMALRKMKRELKMIENNDFSLTGLKGRELRNMTVGVIGTGRIGAETIKCLGGFGCQLMGYDLYPNVEIAHLVSYKGLIDVIASSDILILHCPLTKENKRLIAADTIKLMKDGVVLINTARGGLMDYNAVLEGIENGKISAAAFDVYDEETPYIRKKVKEEEFQSKTLKKLMDKENVIYTAHMSFFTDTAVENMIMTTFENLSEYDKSGQCSNEIIL